MELSTAHETNLEKSYHPLEYLWSRYPAFVCVHLRFLFFHKIYYCYFPLSGGALERGFRRVINDAPVGSLLIQSDSKSGEALLLQATLPFYVRLRHLAETAFVFLLDAQARRSCFPPSIRSLF